MRKYQKFILSLLLLSLHSPLFAQEIIYQCSLPKGKQVTISLVEGVPQYQYGKPNQPEITLPAISGDTNKIHYADFSFSGGGARYYRFTNGDYHYVVYSGVGRGWSREDLTIFKANKKIKRIDCTTLETITANYDPSTNLQEDSDENQETYSG